MIFNNKYDLSVAINEDMKKIAQKVGDCILEEVLYPLLDLLIYDTPDPIVYERLGMNGGFKGAWRVEDIRYGINMQYRKFQTTVSIDSESMRAVHPYHASPEEEDRRDIMASAILFGTDYDYTSSILETTADMMPWTQPRDFWTPLLDFINDPSVESIPAAIEEVFSMENIRFNRSK